MTYKEADEMATNLAKGIQLNNFASDVEYEGNNFKLVGIYGPNCPGWALTDLACIMSNITSATLYDTLGEGSSKYIINQTELKTIFTQASHIKALAQMKEAGDCPTLETLVTFDSGTVEEVKAGLDAGLDVYTIDTVINSGKGRDVELEQPGPDTVFTLCYTSGTTGDPKGVMITHRNILSLSAALERQGFNFTEEDVHLSYLPLAHIFDRAVTHIMIIRGARVGYFNGDVFKLKDDLAELKPTFFVSVPRLYNRFYDAMQAKINELTGVKAALLQKGVNAKLAAVVGTGEVTHKLYDKLLFNKFKEILGG